MKKFPFVAAAFLFFGTNLSVAGNLKFNWRGNAFQLMSGKKEVEVRVNGVVVFELPVLEGENSQTKFIDANYDGYPDIMVLREAGIEKRFNIYLFDKNKGTYLKDNFLSGLACPGFDKKMKTVSSTCNHASACEKWEETYKVSHKKYILISKKGELCNPESGDAFEYRERYERGKIVWQKTFKIENK